MATIVTVTVREHSDVFRGVVAHVSFEGDGSMAHFDAAVREAIKQANLNFPSTSPRARPAPAAQEHQASRSIPMALT